MTSVYSLNLMMFLKCVVSTLLFILISSEKQYVKIELKRCTCFANEFYVDKIKCSYKAVNRTTKFASLDVYFYSGVKLIQPLYLEFIANKKFGTIYRQFMVHIKEDLCESLILKNHPVYQILNHNVKNDSNIMDPCPFMGYRYLKSTSSDYRHLPPMIPIGEWRIDTIISRTKDKNNNSDEVFRFHDFYEVSATDAEQF